MPDRVGFEALRLDDLSVSDQIINVGGSFHTPFVEVKDYAALKITPDVDQLIQGYTEWSIDGVVVHHNYTTAFLGSGDFQVPVGAQYVRIRADNLSTSAATFNVEVFGLHNTPGLFLFPVAAPIDNSFPSALVKSVVTGIGPNGTYANAKTGGPITNNPPTALLLASQQYQSSVYESKGFVSVACAIDSDQVSATNGIIFEWSDTQAFTTVRRRVVRTFNSSDVTVGSKFIILPNQGDYLRITYQNGGTDQTVFFLELRFNIHALDTARDSIESDLDASNTAQMVRSILAARNSNGVYGNIMRSLLQGALQVSIKEQEAEIQQKSCSAEVRSQVSVGIGGSQLDVTQVPNRKYITISNNDGTKSVYYGTDNTNLGTNGILLPAGSIQQQEWDNTVEVWARASTGTCDVRLSQTGGTV